MDNSDKQEPDFAIDASELLELTNKISSCLAQTSDAEIEEGLRCVLGLIGEFFELDRASVWEYRERPASVQLVVDWAASGIDRLPGRLKPSEFPWVAGRLKEGEVVAFAHLDELPDAANVDRLSFERLGTKSHCSWPLPAGVESTAHFDAST